jgi:hypothetical protein
MLKKIVRNARIALLKKTEKRSYGNLLNADGNKDLIKDIPVFCAAMFGIILLGI